MIPFRRVLLATSFLLSGAAPLAAQSSSGSAPVAVFQRSADRTVRIQVVEMGSAAKASLGTGFFVDGEGHVMTNYHVVSRLVTDPRRYRAEFVDRTGKTQPLSVVRIDVVSDLAILATPYRSPAFFALGHPKLEHGAAIRSGTRTTWV